MCCNANIKGVATRSNENKWNLPYKGPEGVSRIRGMKRSLQKIMTDTNIVTIYKELPAMTTVLTRINNVIYKAY